MPHFVEEMTRMLKPMRAAAPALMLALAALIGGCSGEQPDWNLKNVTDVVADLDFKLQQAPDGTTVTEASFADRVRVLFFGFTNCPDICPATLAKVSAALDSVDPETRKQVRVLFVSVDPNRDTLSKLAEYTSAFGPRVTGLTASEAHLRELVKDYNVTFSYGDAYPDGQYNVSHSSAIFVFDREGHARLLGRTSASVEGLASDLKRLVNGA
jgi:protein SCO1/2